MQIRIPRRLAFGHGGKEAPAIAAKFVETFELYGGLNADSSVLDIGCGPGRMALGIGERYGFSTPKYLGFDVRKQDIKWCRKAIERENFTFEHLDVYNKHYNPKGKTPPVMALFPSDTAVFDFAFATSVFTHMRTPEMLAYLREAKRCLMRGGTFLATYFCIEDTGRRARFSFDTKVDDHCYTATPEMPEDVIGYRKDFVLASFKAAGFTDLAFHPGEWSGTKGMRHSQDCVVAKVT